ncbi:hypothetical protein RhiirC2_824783 [Rhizophagus irregularis]|uniref:Uncharacterized protein n=1 Tax=Rhizophagus irregularis TaxID=588596 RepID=A0A2N1M862_9GLOM|nr:hypothetical protein RhiirC2_824783 [Rhizophagus irregularis]
MATTTRNKHKQLAKEAEKQILVQEEESDADSDYKATNSSKSEEEASDQTISDNSDNDVINISEDNDDDDADIGINENVPKKRKPPSKITRPKTSWYRISLEKLKMVLKLFVKLRAVKKCLNGTHHITKGIAVSYLEALQKGDQNLISNIIEEEKSKSHPYSKQELLTNNMIGFVIGTVQPLSIVEDKDFIKMVNGFDLFYKVPCTKTLKERISLAYEAGTEKVKNLLDNFVYLHNIKKEL